MNLQHRIDLLEKLGEYLTENCETLQAIKAQAFAKNGWFNPEFIDAALQNIATSFLQKDTLQNWANHYQLNDTVVGKNVGIVMAGNIPLVGFQDFLCVFVSGHFQTIKLSSKDDVLLKHLVQKLYSWEVTVQNYISFAELLKGCDAYIATGSNNSARYFEQYFNKYPNIIRKNRTSVAILNGQETTADLENLANDIHLYFGLGCRNVTKLYVPKNYDFVPLLNAFKNYKYFADHHKYKNNYDYNLSILLLNNVYYMTNEATLLVENSGLFSPISQLFYEYYNEIADLKNRLAQNDDVQCVVGNNFDIPFGQSQQPSLFNYADGVDTMAFLKAL
jgi:Acyl-CoA reductase (LuxC)